MDDPSADLQLLLSVFTPFWNANTFDPTDERDFTKQLAFPRCLRGQIFVWINLGSHSTTDGHTVKG